MNNAVDQFGGLFFRFFGEFTKKNAKKVAVSSRDLSPKLVTWSCLFCCVERHFIPSYGSLTRIYTPGSGLDSLTYTRNGRESDNNSIPRSMNLADEGQGVRIRPAAAMLPADASASVVALRV